MCGICGVIGSGGAKAPPAGAVQAMARSMRSRGPDGEGLFGRENLVVGHRRLKIIDLSDRASQPMLDPELGLGVVYNGAIYNYKELRERLESDGYRFFSQGDTEVLLKAYHAWGDDFVDRLNGMFAFCLWERDSGRVVLARDRLGIKPLYYAEVPGAMAFASTLPALLEVPGVDTSIDPAALNHYLSFHSVTPPPLTILRGVRKLPPATMMVLEHGDVRQRRYWEPSFDPAPGAADMSFEDMKELVLLQLRSAVDRRMVADVPVGVLLSGGLDSSLVVGLLAQAGQRGLETFSIGFETVGDEEGDEFRYSDIVAREFGTKHHKLQVDAARTLRELPGCVAAMSEPMTSHDNIGFYLLSQEVSKHVKVVQSGQGADEIFAGYHWYPPMLDSVDPVSDYARVFFDRTFEEYQALVSEEHRIDRDASRDFVATHFNRPGAERAVDKALRMDSLVMLVDDPVKRVDNMTMAFGLEARVPFLDHELVEAAARLPAEQKVPGGGKHVLKEAARKVIPLEVIDRPKGYFPVPALKYLRGPFLDLVRDVLNEPAAKQRGLFRQSALHELFADPEAHITPLQGSKLWQAALLEYWLQARGI
ncbi:MAG: N-acetylglutaminylglutamine amidotransferase [Desulfovibrionaceae bacterium]